MGRSAHRMLRAALVLGTTLYGCAQPGHGQVAPPLPGANKDGPPARVIVLPTTHLFDDGSTNKAWVSAFEAHPSGARVYMGVEVSGARRARALGVLTRSGNELSPTPHYVALSDTELSPDASVVVTDVRATERVLYVLWNDRAEGRLTTFDLSPDGIVLEASRKVIALGAPSSGRLAATARTLYVTTAVTPTVLAFPLDGSGHPLPSPSSLETGAGNALALHAFGERIFVGTAGATLVTLDTAGANVGAKATTKLAPVCAANVPLPAAECGAQPLAFVGHGASLFRTYAGPLGPRGRVPFERLGAAALPAEAYALAVDPGDALVWSAEPRTTKTRDGKDVVVGTKLVARDAATLATREVPGASDANVPNGYVVGAMAVARDTKTLFVLAELPVDGEEFRVGGDIAESVVARFTLTDLVGREALPALPFDATLADLGPSPAKPLAVHFEAVGKTTPWISLDGFLTGAGAKSTHALALHLAGGPEPAGDNTLVAKSLTDAPRFTARVELATRDASGRVTPVKTEQDGPIYGRSLTFFAPGANVRAFDRGAFKTLTSLSSEWASDAEAVKVKRAPRAIHLGCYAMLAHGATAFVENVARATSALGCNEITSDYAQLLPRPWVDERFRAYGMPYVGAKSISRFDASETFSAKGPALDTSFARSLVASEEPGSLFHRQGAKATQLRTVLLDDEPSWPLGPRAAVYEAVARDATAKARLRAWVARANEAREETGFSVGAEARLATAQEPRGTVDAKRRYLATVRYLSETVASRALDTNDTLAATVAALPECKAEGACDYVAGINWNNGTAHRTSMLAYESYGTVGSYDWFATMRAQAERPGRALGTASPRPFVPWIDTKYTDTMARLATFRADVARSAAELPHLLPGKTPSPFTRFGVYVTVGVGAPMRDGLAYKVLAAVSRGARHVEYWAFGPSWLLPDDGFSEARAFYKEVARASEKVAFADTLLATGTRPRGRVAIQAEGVSSLWSKGEAAHLYEPAFLHGALTDAGFAVEMVDDESLARGVAKAAFDVVFLTQAHTTTRARRAIADWVTRDGGTLVALPGAGSRDEVDRPVTDLDPILGMTKRADGQGRLPPVVPGTTGYSLAGSLTAARPGSLPEEAVFQPPCERAGCRLGELVVNDAEVVARLGTSAGITRKTHPSGGVAYAYAFFPGLQHWLALEGRSVAALPETTSPAPRVWASLPAQDAERRKPNEAYRHARTSVPGVEAAVVRSAKGVAIVLFNWTGRPLPQGSVDVTLLGRDTFALAFHGDLSALTPRRTAEGTTVTVPLETVDVVRLCHRADDPECR
ncbi:MAG: hypothetical protein U0183_34335 [Polyangiaceae bacterium]